MSESKDSTGFTGSVSFDSYSTDGPFASLQVVPDHLSSSEDEETDDFTMKFPKVNLKRGERAKILSILKHSYVENACYPGETFKYFRQQRPLIADRLSAYMSEKIGWIYISANLHAALGLGEAVVKPKHVLCDVFIVWLDNFMMILSIAKRHQENIKRYNVNIVQAFLTRVKEKTGCSLSVVNGVVAETDCKNEDVYVFNNRLADFIADARIIAMPGSLEMDKRKCEAVLDVLRQLESSSRVSSSSLVKHEEASTSSKTRISEIREKYDVDLRKNPQFQEIKEDVLQLRSDMTVLKWSMGVSRARDELSTNVSDDRALVSSEDARSTSTFSVSALPRVTTSTESFKNPDLQHSAVLRHRLNP